MSSPPRFVALHDRCWPSVIWVSDHALRTIGAVALPLLAHNGVKMNMHRSFAENARFESFITHVLNLLSNSASGSSPNSSASKESPSSSWQSHSQRESEQSSQ